MKKKAEAKPKAAAPSKPADKAADKKPAAPAKKGAKK
jgi:hypothetical protein